MTPIPGDLIVVTQSPDGLVGMAASIETEAMAELAEIVLGGIDSPTATLDTLIVTPDAKWRIPMARVDLEETAERLELKTQLVAGARPERASSAASPPATVVRGSTKGSTVFPVIWLGLVVNTATD